MYHRSECKNTKPQKFLEDNIKENLDALQYVDDFLDTAPKALYLKETTDKLTFSKFKTSSL